jgi:hypothetical protein
MSQNQEKYANEEVQQQAVLNLQMQAMLGEVRHMFRTEVEQFHKRLDRLENVRRGQPRNIPNVHRRETISASVQRVYDEVARLQKERERKRESDQEIESEKKEKERETNKIESEDKEKAKEREAKNIEREDKETAIDRQVEQKVESEEGKEKEKEGEAKKIESEFIEIAIERKLEREDEGEIPEPKLKIPLPSSIFFSF